MDIHEQSRSRILLVEDDQLSREALACILEVEGYAVETAQDGKTALGLLHSPPRPSAVLLDLGLPVITGFEFLERQKSDLEIADIPVVVITAMFEPSVPKADAVLQKPIDLPELMSLLSKIIS